MSFHRQSDRKGDPVSAGIWDILMKRIIRWLITLLSRQTEITVADQPTKPLSVKSDDIAQDQLESGKNDLMPDIYAVKNVDTVPDLEILDLSTPDLDESAGFNPYDTAILRTKLGPKPR